MAGQHRVVAHYWFKQGQEGEGAKFLMTQLLPKAIELGCPDAELCQDESDPCHWIATGNWSSLDARDQLRIYWEGKASELAQYLARAPKREFFLVASGVAQKSRKVA